MNIVNIFFQKKKLIKSWNNTYKTNAFVTFPKTLDELRNLFKEIKKKKKFYIIRTGSCSYDSKSIPANENTLVISLNNFKKIIKINYKESTIIVEAGAMLSDIVKQIKDKNFTLYSWWRENFYRRGNFSQCNW